MFFSFNIEPLSFFPNIQIKINSAEKNKLYKLTQKDGAHIIISLWFHWLFNVNSFVLYNTWRPPKEITS